MIVTYFTILKQTEKGIIFIKYLGFSLKFNHFDLRKILLLLGLAIYFPVYYLSARLQTQLKHF